ncbi:Activating signal cointegrator 1 complex subunit 1 [Brachionus plicatilis]|uniref:Activating signal cointegrator 1 complex subunit 1 n=1 Tax=Brachionus plicatilis TaxID=10195 RepID=A0A3M7QBC2_BRAPC|nr:Activating signal cointegrator 1 complex subunit 1 [Brachionus plicatilis]
MNILQPQIVRIGNRRYRHNHSTFKSNDPIEPYEEETDEMFVERKVGLLNDEEYNDEACYLECKQIPAVSDQFNQIEFVNGYYKLDLCVAEAFYGSLIGRNGEKKSKLERDTQTSVRIPRRNQGDTVTIEGNDKKSIISCLNRLQLMIQTARSQKPFTHLITFPLKFDQLKHRFKEFIDLVLRDCSQDRGVHESIFQLPNKLHLTVNICTILSEFELDQAASLLEKCKKSFISDLLNGKKLKVQIKGLEYMNDDPAQVDVLYAKVTGLDSVNALQSIADGIMKTFVESGYARKQFERVKLHATVMNSLRRVDMSVDNEFEDKKESKSQRESFDCRNILKFFGDYDFGIYVLEEIHLSLRFTSAPDGYYECISKINF